MSGFDKVELNKSFADFLINTTFVCTIDFNCFYIKDDHLICGVFRRGEKVTGTGNIKYKIPSYYILNIEIGKFKTFIRNVINQLYNKLITYETVDHIRSNYFIVNDTFYHRHVESYQLKQFDFLGNIKIEYSESYKKSKVFNIDNLEAYYVILQTYINDLISFRPLTAFGFRVVKFSVNSDTCFTYVCLKPFIDDLIKRITKELKLIDVVYGLENSINFYNYFNVFDVDEVELIDDMFKKMDINDDDEIEIIDSIKK